MKDDLIASARRRLAPTKKRTRHVDLRRAISDAYYALFHALCQMCADELIGATYWGSDNWLRVYRSVDHKPAKNKLRALAGSHTDQNVRSFAAAFVLFQEQRHIADYDPTPPKLKRESALALVDEAETAIRGINSTSAADRRKLAVELLFPDRQKN